ncbi:uncharacterized protein EI97DRAFT_488728, partial [Westerdykella ornata]
LSSYTRANRHTLSRPQKPIPERARSVPQVFAHAFDRPARRVTMSRTRKPGSNKEQNRGAGARRGTEKKKSLIVKLKLKPKSRLIIPREPSIELGVLPSKEIPTQHEMVERCMREAGVHADFMLLPEANDLTFEDAEEEMKRLGLFTRKLFLGGRKAEPPYEVWAYLKTYESKAGEIYVYRVTKKNGEEVERKMIEGASWGDTELIYPFQVLVRLGTADARKQLNTLIQYAFLDAKEVDRVWVGEARYAMTLLKRAVRHIAKAYKLYPGGVAAVPDLFRPVDLYKDAVPITNRALYTFRHLTAQMERVSVTPFPAGPNRTAEGAGDELELQRELNRFNRARLELRQTEEKRKTLKREMEEARAKVAAILVSGTKEQIQAGIYSFMNLGSDMEDGDNQE